MIFDELTRKAKVYQWLRQGVNLQNNPEVISQSMLNVLESETIMIMSIKYLI